MNRYLSSLVVLQEAGSPEEAKKVLLDKCSAAGIKLAAVIIPPKPYAPVEDRRNDLVVNSDKQLATVLQYLQVIRTDGTSGVQALTEFMRLDAHLRAGGTPPSAWRPSMKAKPSEG